MDLDTGFGQYDTDFLLEVNAKPAAMLMLLLLLLLRYCNPDALQYLAVIQCCAAYCNPTALQLTDPRN